MSTEPSNRGRTLALTGAWLQLGPVVGGLGTVVGMMLAFDTLSAAGISDPRQLSGEIGFVLIFTAIGLFVGLIGLVLVCIALFSARYRASWFYWFLVIYGALMIPGFPLGTVIGIIFLVYCLKHKTEFLDAHESPPNEQSP